MLGGNLVAFEDFAQDGDFDAVEWCIVLRAGSYVVDQRKARPNFLLLSEDGRERKRARIAGTSSQTWQDGTMAEEKKGTNVRRGSNGAAMMLAAKPMRRKTTRERGMVVCLGKGGGRIQRSML